MSNVLRKKITIASNCALTVYGGTFGPIRTPFYETIPNIARLICDGIEVYEETPNGKVRLTMSNFDKFQDDEARIAKENEAAKAKAEEAARVAKAKAEEAARVAKAQQEQRAREEQQRINQRNNNQRNNNQKNNNNQQQPKQVTADVIVEE